MSITDSLDAAATALRGLLAEEDLSNVVFAVAQDVGSQDLVILQSNVAIPLQTNVMILVDVAYPNEGGSPIVRLPGGQQIYVTTSTGASLAGGAMAGKCLIGISSVGNGGFEGRLLVSPNVVPPLNSGPGVTIAGGAGKLDLITVPTQDVINNVDYVAMLCQEIEGEDTEGSGVTRITPMENLAGYVLTWIKANGGAVGSGPGVDVINNEVRLQVGTLPGGDSLQMADRFPFLATSAEGPEGADGTYSCSLYAIAETIGSKIIADNTSTPNGTNLLYRVYATPGNYTYVPDPGCVGIRVRAWGGGGGGGNAGGYVGAGGGGGGYAEGSYAVTPGVSYPVTCGAGGTPQVTGGSSTVGSFISATGGGGATGNQPGGGGAGYSIGTAQLAQAGEAGAIGGEPGGGNVFVGTGGPAFSGGPSNGGIGHYNGFAPGGGACGGGDDGGQSGYTGGNGLVVIEQIFA